MGRLVRDSRLESREARLRLKVNKEPYWKLISEGIHLGYYRGSRGGMWHARARRYSKTTIGKADDFITANGKDILSFPQAQEEARKFASKTLHGEDITDNSYTIKNAVDDYLADFKANGKKSFYTTKTQIIAHILPTFGDKTVASLTFKQLTSWKNKLATTHKRLRSSKKTGETQKFVTETNNNPDYERRRRSTANRIITILKAILNHAYNTNRIHSNEAWKKLKPFRNVAEARIRFLSEAEITRLLNACEPDFRLLVKGALLTGARYGELTILKAQDYNANNKNIFIQQSKNGKSRHIPLNEDGIQFFEQLTVGKIMSEFAFTRSNGSPWRKNYQVRPLEIACQTAKITPAISFHILRHTYGSLLAMRGVPIQVIATVLGHSDTRITHKHYAHLTPSYVADVIKQHLPRFYEAENESNVIGLNKKISLA
jgi:integrase